MAKLRFDIADVRRCAEHAVAAERHKLTFGEREKIFGKGVFDAQPDEDKRGSPGLWLVKDSGIYIMSNGVPGDHVVTTSAKRPQLSDGSLFVTYAKGYDKNADYNKIREAAGGDDFCERIDLGQSTLEIIRDPATTAMIVGLTENRMTISFESEATYSRAELRTKLEAMFKETPTVFLGIKPGGRKMNVWRSPKPLDAMKRRAITGQYRNSVILTGMPIDKAVDAYATAFGITLR